MYPNQDPVQPVSPQPDPAIGVAPMQPAQVIAPDVAPPQPAGVTPDPYQPAVQPVSAAVQPDPMTAPNPQQNLVPAVEPVPVSAMPAFMQGGTAQPSAALQSVPMMQPDPVMQQTDPFANAGLAPTSAAGENLDKNYLVALLLAYFMGIFGADRFYLGRTKTAIIKLVTLGGLGVWAVADVLRIAFGRLTAQDDPRPLQGFAKEFPWAKNVAVVVTTVSALLFLSFIILFIVTGAMTVGKLD